MFSTGFTTVDGRLCETTPGKNFDFTYTSTDWNGKITLSSQPAAAIQLYDWQTNTPISCSPEYRCQYTPSSKWPKKWGTIYPIDVHLKKGEIFDYASLGKLLPGRRYRMDVYYCKGAQEDVCSKCSEFEFKGQCSGTTAVFKRTCPSGCNEKLTYDSLDSPLCKKETTTTTRITTTSIAATTTTTIPSQIPEPTSIIKNAGQNFKVKFASAPKEPLKAGKTATYQVSVENVGNEGWMFVETGIYQDQFLDRSGSGTTPRQLYSLSDVGIKTSNCKPDEKNVQRKAIYLKRGQTTTETFQVTVPTEEELAGTFESFKNLLTGELITKGGGETDLYDTYTNSHFGCYVNGWNGGATSEDRIFTTLITTTVTSEKNCPEENQQGNIDCGESDIDCGGGHKQIQRCISGQVCREVSDCEPGLACQTKTGRDYKTCQPPIEDTKKIKLEKGKSLPLTKDEYEDATDEMILSSLCDTTSDCAEKENSNVKCLKSADIQKRNEEAESAGKNYYCDIANSQGFNFFDLAGGTLDFFGITDLNRKMCAGEGVPSGTCRAESKFGFLGGIIDSIGTTASIIIGALIIILLLGSFFRR